MTGLLDGLAVALLMLLLAWLLYVLYRVFTEKER